LSSLVLPYETYRACASLGFVYAFVRALGRCSKRNVIVIKLKILENYTDTKTKYRFHENV